MAYTTLVAGTTITAAWANASVRDQGVNPFTDSTARASAITAPVAGMVSVLTTTKRADVYNGASWSALVAPAFDTWTTYTPTFVQSVTITKTVGYAGYIRVGRMIKGMFHMTATSAGTAANLILVGVPVTILTAVATDATFGAAAVQDIGSGNFVAVLAKRSGTEVGFLVGAGYIGTSQAMTVASGDIFSGEFSYPADSDA